MLKRVATTGEWPCSAHNAVIRHYQCYDVITVALAGAACVAFYALKFDHFISSGSARRF